MQPNYKLTLHLELMLIQNNIINMFPNSNNLKRKIKKCKKRKFKISEIQSTKAFLLEQYNIFQHMFLKLQMYI